MSRDTMAMPAHQCVATWCRAMNLRADRVAEVVTWADCLEDLRGSAPEDIDGLIAHWKPLVAKAFRRHVAALREEARAAAALGAAAGAAGALWALLRPGSLGAARALWELAPPFAALGRALAQRVQGL